jgi:hypothetical protein
MTSIQLLKNSQTKADLAHLLGYTPKGMSYLIYKSDVNSRYSAFEIPKKSGGVRVITAPNDKLKLLQRRLADLLQDCHDEIYKSSNSHRHLSHGFRRDHSIFTNAKRHRNKSFIFNLDLEDFFDSFNFGRVRGFFIKDKNFELNHDVATAIAQIACHKNKLPQGSPCSPVITNLILHILDIRLSRLASKNNCVYTRYADDLTFSTNEKYFPSEIAKPGHEDFDIWQPGRILEKEIDKAGFSVNAKKNRMHYPGNRMEVTGLSVNKVINTKREYRSSTRSMVNRLIGGKIISIDRDYDPNEENEFASVVSIISGRLAHIHHIDRRQKTTKDGGHNHQKIENHEGVLSSRDQTYRDFLVYTRFVNAKQPIVICEGQTDSIYLKCAIKNIGKIYRNISDKNGSLLIRFLKYSPTTANVLRLGGGSEHMATFIDFYIDFISKTKTKGLGEPVIIFIDNDKGAKCIFGRYKKYTGNSIDLTKPFHRIKYNLYIVVIPKIKNSDTCIEDFFDDKTLGTTLNGKTFTKENNFNRKKHYGKKIFAERVIYKNQENINFAKFDEILSQIDLAIGDYRKIPKP